MKNMEEKKIKRDTLAISRKNWKHTGTHLLQTRGNSPPARALAKDTCRDI